MLDIGMPELIVIFIVALLVFGPKRLPELGKTIGKGMAELKKAMQGVKAELHEIEQPASPGNMVDKNDEKQEKTTNVTGETIKKDEEQSESTRNEKG